MLYLFHGDDANTNHLQADSFLKQLSLKRPDVSVFVYDTENWNPAHVDELSFGQGLFTREHVVVAREILALPDVEEFVINHLLVFAESPNVFIFIENKVSSKVLRLFVKYAKKIWKSESKDNEQQVQKKNKLFNLFSLGDAFLSRDRKKAWALFCRAVDNEGVAVEHIHGVIFAQVKNMLLVKHNPLVNPGLHPFVFQKTKQSSQRYSEDELKEFSTLLMRLYHDARKGINDMRASLELLLLKI